MVVRMKRWKRFVLFLLVIFVLAVPTLSVADFGDFESYDYDDGWDSDWGSSYDSDWNSSSYYDRYDRYDGYYDSDRDMEGGWLVIIIIFIIIVFVASKSNGSNRMNSERPSHSVPNLDKYGAEKFKRSPVRSKGVAEKVIAVDPHFNEETFISNAKNLFVKLQNAWSERNLETIRPLVSAELFDQYSKNIQNYIESKKRNKIERIATNYGELVSFYQDNEKDMLIVAVNSSMVDYIVDEEKGVILKGDNSTKITNTYKMTFTRKKGILTEEGTSELKTTNCPNCGAPTTITSSGKCPYCNSVITIGSHDWVLSGIEKF